MKRVLLVVLALVLIVSLSLTSLAASKVTLRVAWWGNPTRDARTLETIKLYTTKNPNVIIEPEYTSWGGYWDKIATQAAANNMPDIMQQDYAYLLQYVNKGLMLDLTPYVKSKAINLTKVDETFLSGGKVDGKFYGISLGTNAMGLGYDPAILAKAGLKPPTKKWTWADLEKMAITIYNKTGVKTIPFGTTDPRPIFENWVRQTGASFYNAQGTALGFTDPQPLIDYYEMQVRLLKAGALIKPDTAFVQTTVNEAPFAKGSSWLDFIWSNQLVMQADANQRPVTLFLMPRIAKSKRPGTYLKPSMFFSISKSCANKDEAVKFLDFFLNDLEANKILLAERGIPIIPSVRKSLKDLVSPVDRQVFDFIDLVGDGNASPIDPPDPPNSGEVLAIFRTALQEVLYGTMTPKDAATKFMKDANAILAKNK